MLAAVPQQWRERGGSARARASGSHRWPPRARRCPPRVANSSRARGQQRHRARHVAREGAQRLGFAHVDADQLPQLEVRRERRLHAPAAHESTRRKKRGSTRAAPPRSLQRFAGPQHLAVLRRQVMPPVTSGSGSSAHAAAPASCTRRPRAKSRAMVSCAAAHLGRPLGEDHDDVRLAARRGTRCRRRARRSRSRRSCGPRARPSGRPAGMPLRNSLLVQDVQHGLRGVGRDGLAFLDQRASASHRPAAVTRLLMPASQAASSSTPRCRSMPPSCRRASEARIGFDADQVEQQVGGEVAAGHDHVLGQFVHRAACCPAAACTAALASRSSATRYGLPSTTPRKRLRTCTREYGLEAALLDGVVHAQQHRHLDRAGRVEPAVRVERPGRVVFEIVGRHRDGRGVGLFADLDHGVAQRCLCHSRYAKRPTPDAPRRQGNGASPRQPQAMEMARAAVPPPAPKATRARSATRHGRRRAGASVRRRHRRRRAPASAGSRPRTARRALRSPA